MVDFNPCETKVLIDRMHRTDRVALMRFQTRCLQRVVRVFTLTAALLSIPATKSFAQASLFDPTFNVGHGANGIVYGIVVQDDGKIVVGGEFTQIAGEARTNLARLNSNGQLDASFPQGTDGTVYQLLKQPDGKILVGGAFTNLQGLARQRIGRILTNGFVDSSFDAGTNIASEVASYALAFQADGKVLAASFFPTALNLGSQLQRFHPNGDLDSIFVQTNIFHDWIVTTICPRMNGTILIGGGFQRVNNISSPALALVNTNGQFDPNFISPLGTNSMGHLSLLDVMVDLPDNSVLIGGKFWQKDSTNRSAVAKLTAALDWDTSFQPDGFDPVVGDTQIGLVRCAVRQPDGKFVLGGLFQEVGGYWRRDIVRLDAQGKVDPCFDPGIGLGDEYSSSGDAGVQTIARQTNGEIVAGGKFVNFTGGTIASVSSSNLVRFLPQSDCDVTRVYLLDTGLGQDAVIGTCAPGGTNYLQISTNLVDWSTFGSGPSTITTSPYVLWFVPRPLTLEGGLFFRVKKEY